MSQQLQAQLPDLTRVFGANAAGVIERIIDALCRAVPVEEIWLFGSCARGTAGPDSDLDLLVVLSDDHGLARPTLACYRALRQLRTRIPMDVLAITRSRWERDRAEGFGLVGDVCRGGIRLYAQRRKESPELV
ncbi:MAG: nucleotidyltransferase domain-containing protein [Verrucomicrobiae bacterium]|nr:nucleotidyltransferase domain-containing protein [Verrucomicrobiae bacterium]